MQIDNISKKLTRAMQTPKEKTSAYDTRGVVARIEEDIAWVRLTGSSVETPVRMTIAASKGDVVQVRVSGGTAWLTGNGSAPPTDDTTANKSYKVATQAGMDAAVARDDAAKAYNYATQAEAEATRAKTAADIADEKAEAAGEAAEEAESHAQTALTNAGLAQTAANEAKTSANEAKQQASTATDYANNALVQLSVVEDVAGTLDWIQKHGTYTVTSDTTVQPGKVYFELISGEYVPIASPDPTKNPHEEGWYVLDITDSQTEYIMAHIAVTSAGLWVLPSGMASGTTPASGESQDDSDARQGQGYKALLSSTGLKIYDGTGHLVSTFGENIIFDSSRQQVIGGQNNYILFDPTDGSITINGNNVKIGNTGKKLSEVLTDIDVSVTQTDTGADITINGDTVSIENGQDGAQGPKGDTAEWFYGTALTHTSGTATATIPGAVVGSMYLNTETSLVYKCTAISGSTMTWTYAGDLTTGVIDGLEIGGRNLLLSTEDIDGWLKESDISVVFDPSTGMHKITDASHTSGRWGIYQDVACEPNTTYTLAVDGKIVSEPAYMAVQSFRDTPDWPSNRQTFTTEKQRLSYTWTTGSDHNIIRVYLCHSPSAANQYWNVYHPKLEKGNVATDWTPAPEDLEEYANDRVESAVVEAGNNMRSYVDPALETKVDTVDADGGTSLLSNIRAVANMISLAAQQIVFEDPSSGSESTVFDALSTINGAISIDTTVPSITIGNSALAFHIVITDQEIEFYQGQDNMMAYMNGSEMYVDNKLSFGKFQFYERENGHFTLKLIDNED